MKAAVEEEVQQLLAQKKSMKERLDILKAALYSRLGDAVYLEYEADGDDE
jgi:chaperonin cofactor prefoldin